MVVYCPCTGTSDFEIPLKRRLCKLYRIRMVPRVIGRREDGSLVERVAVVQKVQLDQETHFFNNIVQLVSLKAQFRTFDPLEGLTDRKMILRRESKLILAALCIAAVSHNNSIRSCRRLNVKICKRNANSFPTKLSMTRSMNISSFPV